MAGTLFPSSADKENSINNNIIIKASYKNKDLLDNSLDVEVAIYKNIITNLVNNHHTPCVMAYLGSGVCTDSSIFKLPRSINDAFEQETQNIRESDDWFDFDHISLLYLEKSNGIQLKDWITPSRSEKDVLSIIFQIVYTLMCFSNIRLRHNDLHFGNIFIEELPAPISMYFARGGDRYVELKTKWLAKIYDFDRGSCLHPAVPRNLLLDFHMCNNYGTCNAPNNKFDLFTFIYMLHYGYGENLNPDIKLNIKTQWIAKMLRWIWYYEIIQDNVNDFRQSIRHTPKDSDMKSPRESLSIFIDATWSDSPFTTINLSPAEVSHIPVDMLFTPPADRSEQEPILWQPITTESHQALIYGSIDENVVYWGDEATVRLKPVKDIWDREVTAIHGYIEQGKILFNKIKEAKLIPESLTKLYTMAAFLLQLPIWYELDVESQQAVANPMVRKAISDVWNMFSNKLPIQITRRT
jgi:hypothetical protein